MRMRGSYDGIVKRRESKSKNCELILFTCPKCGWSVISGPKDNLTCGKCKIKMREGKKFPS